MRERLTQFRAKAVQYWNQTNKTQKVGFISGIVLLIVVLAITIFSLTRTEYSYAFRDLDSMDAAAITNYLQEQGISYQLSSDGRSIGVPTTVANQVKINVESMGLVKNGSIGYGIFKENISSFGMTDNEFNVLKADALAGEIQQLINGMNGVRDSKVLIQVPADNVFLSETQNQSSAVARITFVPGFRPDQAMIDTIYNFIAHSLPNIAVENITVSDQQGELLPSSKMSGAGSSAGQVAEQFTIKKQFENDIQRNVQSMLGRIFPPEKVVVSVISSLNFDKKNSTEHLVRPVNEVDAEGIEISVERIQESYSSETGGNPGGVVGTGSNDIPGYTATDVSGQTESESLTERINYDVNRISNEIISAPFQVKDLTINVAVEPPIKNDPASLTPEVKADIQTILTNVVRASLADSGNTYTEEELNRKVYVFAHSFDGVQEFAAPTIFTNGMFYGLLAIALAVIVVGTLVVFRRRKADMIEEEELAPQMSKQEIPTIDLETVTNESQVRKQLESLARKRPEEFVSLLRTWLVDE